MDSLHKHLLFVRVEDLNSENVWENFSVLYSPWIWFENFMYLSLSWGIIIWQTRQWNELWSLDSVKSTLLNECNATGCYERSGQWALSQTSWQRTEKFRGEVNLMWRESKNLSGRKMWKEGWKRYRGVRGLGPVRYVSMMAKVTERNSRNLLSY